MIDLRLGDCLTILPTLPYGCVDAVITDPPYGMGLGKRSGGPRGKACKARDDYAVMGDDVPFNPQHLLGYSKVILWGANHYAAHLPSSRSWWVWDKREGIPSNDQADCELAWTNHRGPERLFHHLWNGMIKASEQGESRVHPTQKPLSLMIWCIDYLKLRTGATILDPYMGSGTTGVAAVSLGFNFIGIEKDPAYFAIAERRIHEAQQQLQLFAEVK